MQEEGAVQAIPGMVQILVTGQQAWPVAHSLPFGQATTVGIKAPEAFLTEMVVGLRHFKASGQQYSLAEHTGVPTEFLTPVIG